jgi:hypothetical protein
MGFSGAIFSAPIFYTKSSGRNHSRKALARGFFPCAGVAASRASTDDAGQSCHSEKILQRSLFDHVAS